MFELYAKKRPINGVGSPFEWICNFDREDDKYSITDQLDREIYKECIIVCGERVVLYREFQKPYVKKRRK